MKKLLFVNACMRAGSRTEMLAREYLRRAFPRDEFAVQEVPVAALDIQPLSGDDVAARDADIAAGRTDTPPYALARDFAQADEIVVAAPFWDAAFPAKLKVYLEHICVRSVTFGYRPDGSLARLCRAPRLTYITTAGGPLRAVPAVRLLWEELCAMFAIGDLRFYCADGLDTDPAAAEAKLESTLRAMLADRRESGEGRGEER